MKIQLLYFAAVRDLVKKDEEMLEVEAKTIGALAGELEQRYPALAGRMNAVRLARNEEFARAEDPIAEGDVIALIPPVAGG